MPRFILKGSDSQALCVAEAPSKHDAVLWGYRHLSKVPGFAGGVESEDAYFARTRGALVESFRRALRERGRERRGSGSAWPRPLREQGRCCRVVQLRHKTRCCALARMGRGDVVSTPTPSNRANRGDRERACFRRTSRFRHTKTSWRAASPARPSRTRSARRSRRSRGRQSISLWPSRRRSATRADEQAEGVKR